MISPTFGLEEENAISEDVIVKTCCQILLMDGSGRQQTKRFLRKISVGFVIGLELEGK